MSIDITAEVMIARSRDDVATFATNPNNDPLWIGGIVEAEMMTEPPLGVATKVRRVAKFLGRRMDYAPEIVQYEPAARLVMRTNVPFDMTIGYEFQEAGDGTLARIHIQGEGSGFFKLAEPLLARMVKRNIGNDLKKLKGLLESEAEER